MVVVVVLNDQRPSNVLLVLGMKVMRGKGKLGSGRYVRVNV